MKPQKIKFESDGTYANSKLYIGNRQVYFESISISGAVESDLDIAIGLSTSKVSKKELKDATGGVPAGFTHAEGYEVDEDYLEEDE